MNASNPETIYSAGSGTSKTLTHNRAKLAEKLYFIAEFACTAKFATKQNKSFCSLALSFVVVFYFIALVQAPLVKLSRIKFKCKLVRP